MTQGPEAMLNLTLNGKHRSFPALGSLKELLGHLDLDPLRVAVELNGAIVARERFDATALAEGDRLEIIQFVGGG